MKFIFLFLIGAVVGRDIIDLRHLASDYFHTYCKHTAHRSEDCLDWIDLTDGHDKHHPERAIKVDEITDLKYHVKEKITKPSLTLAQDYCNSGNESGSMEFKKSHEVSSTCSWSVSVGLKYSESITEKIGVPTLESTSFSETVEMDFSTTKSSSVEHKDTWEIDVTVPAPPHTWVFGTYVVEESDFSTDWTAIIKFKGCVNVWFHDKYDVNHDGDKHNEWWFYPSKVFGGTSGFTCGSDVDLGNFTKMPHGGQHPSKVGKDECEKSWCKFKASGTYKGIGGAAAHLDTKHKKCPG